MSKSRGLTKLQPGQIAHVVLAEASTNEPSRMVGAGIGLAVPAQGEQFGLVYGSCFGLESFKQYSLWHDPLEGDPMALMYGAIGIGIVMISLGLILNIIKRFRRGDVMGGLLDKFGVIGALFYWGVLALIAKYAVIESRGLIHLAIFVFLVVPLVGWALKEPLEYFAHRHARPSGESSDGLFAAITESLVGAFEAVLSYFANTISFVRLAAYVMSHAALLVAAFMMEERDKAFVPRWGSVERARHHPRQPGPLCLRGSLPPSRHCVSNTMSSSESSFRATAGHSNRFG